MKRFVMRRPSGSFATITTIEGRRHTPARWRIVDAHECTLCGHLVRDGYRMVEHLRTHTADEATP